MRASVNYIIYWRLVALLVLCVFTGSFSAAAQTGANDTILVRMVVFNGDTIEAKTLSEVTVFAIADESKMSARAKWTRLRNAVYVTFPYAKKAGVIMNEINAVNANVSSEKQRKQNIHAREKELRKEFTEPLTNLSIYQGKVLMKLINRETHNNCYEIIKEYKGAVTARLYQTVAFFFGTNLKQAYDAGGSDAEMEQIVQEVERMYGFRS